MAELHLNWHFCLIVLCFTPIFQTEDSHGLGDGSVHNNTNYHKQGNYSVTSGTATSHRFEKLVDDYTLHIFIIVQYCIISSLVNFFGIITNTLNIITFVRQGFSETVNVSLLGLAISDMGNLITLQCLNIFYAPVLVYSDLPFYSLDVQYLAAGWPHVAFTRITAWITAFVTLERCICISFPLKVKTIITKKRAIVIVISIFVVLIGSVAPIYYTSRLIWKFSEERNRTVLSLAFTKDRETVDSITFALNNVVLPFLAFIIVVVSTVILIVKLKQKSKWREGAVSKGGQRLASKDKRIVKMVSVISIIFIICSLPNIILFSVMSAVPDFSIDGQYRNLLMLTFSYSFIAESINSSINIFLYLKMSTKFRETFKQTFPRCSRTRE